MCYAPFRYGWVTSAFVCLQGVLYSHVDVSKVKATFRVWFFLGLVPFRRVLAAAFFVVRNGHPNGSKTFPLPCTGRQ